MRLKIWNALLAGAYNRICLCRSDSVSIKSKLVKAKWGRGGGGEGDMKFFLS